MLRIKNIIQYAIIVLCASAHFVSCTKENGPSAGNRQYAVVQLSLSTDEMLTRAVLSDAEETKINSLRIYAYAHGRRVGYFYGSPVPSTILMDIEVLNGGTSEEVTFYVLANEGAALHPGHEHSFDENSSLSELQSRYFTSLNTGMGLPMFGTVKESVSLTSVSASPETSTYQTVTIPLERAVSKVGVYFAKAEGLAADLEINQITILKEGARISNYLLPQTEAVLEAVPTSLDDIVALTAPVKVTSYVSLNTDGDSHDIKDLSLFTHVISSYAFENPSAASDWMTPSADGKNLKLRIDYTLGGVHHTQYVNMPAIVRNTHYLVNAVVSQDKGQIFITWDVADWNDAGEWELEFNYPTYQNPLQPSSAFNPVSGKYENPAYGPAEMYYVSGNSEKGAFCVDFQMAAPKGQTWTPTFLGEAGDYEIRVYVRGTSTLVYSSSAPGEYSQLSASDNWYTIKIIPLDQTKVGSTVKFVITYKPIWQQANDFLIINGSDSHPVWTGPGANSEVIVVTQTETK